MMKSYLFHNPNRLCSLSISINASPQSLSPPLSVRNTSPLKMRYVDFLYLMVKKIIIKNKLKYLYALFYGVLYLKLIFVFS